MNEMKIEQLIESISSVHDDFKKEIKECYAPYATNIEDTRSFGKMNGSA